MIINKIRLKNFKSHLDSTITIGEGLSIILGSNGAGKSTILEAISYSLFKEFTGKVNDLIRKKSDETDIIKEMKVTVYFNHNGKDYILTRGKKGSKNIAELREINEDNTGLLIKGDTVVTREIEEILGVDKTSYTNAVYIRQGEITSLIDKSAGERKELIAKLLNIDNLQKSWENMLNLIKEYEIKQEVNQQLLLNKEDDEKEKEEIIEELEILEDEIKNEEKVINDKEKVLNERSNELELLRKKETKYIQYTSSIENMKSNIENEKNNKKDVESEIKKIEKLEEENKKYEDEIRPLPYMEELVTKKQEYDKNNIEYTNINENLEKINKQKNILNNTKENHDKYLELKETYESLRKNKEEITQKKQSLELKKELLEENTRSKDEYFNKIRKIVSYAQQILNNSFSNADEVKKASEESLTKYQKDIDEYNNAINQNKIKISSYKTTIESTQKSLKELEQTENTCPICQSEISHDKHEQLSKEYRNTIIECENNIKKLDDENNDINQKILSLNSKIDEIKTIDLEELSTSYVKFQDLNDKIKRMKDDLNDYETVQVEYDNITNQINALENDIKKLLEDYENYNTAKTILKDYDEEKLNNRRIELDDIQNKLKNNMLELQSKFRPVDNIRQEIKFLNEKKKNVEMNKGKISTKDSLYENIKRIENNLTQWNNQLDNTKEELQELSFDAEYYKKINETYTSFVKEMENIKEEHVKKTNTLEHLKNKNDELTKKLKEYSKLTKQQEHLKDYIKLLNEIREIYSKDSVQKDLINQVKPLIEKETKEIFDEFEFGYKDVQLDEEYNITILNNDNEIIPLNLLSGGEKIVIALSLRLAIAKAIDDTKTDLLILDEPTIHLDEDRRGELVEILRQANIAPQMIVITHDNEMVGMSNNIIRISKTPEGISSVISE